MQNRLTEIETRLAFQEDAWQALNTVIARQQREMAALADEIRALKAQLRALASTADAVRPDDSRPPHY